MPAKEQMWLRSTNDSNGWFTLRNLASGKFLTAVGSNSDPGQWKLTIQGNTIQSDTIQSGKLNSSLPAADEKQEDPR